MGGVYDFNGNRLDEVSADSLVFSPWNALSGKIISHRCLPYPENTIEGAELKAKDGFTIMEVDVSFTSDGVPVVCHGGAINNHARNLDGSAISGTVTIESLTYEQTQNYDFGVYKGSQYAGIKCPTLREFCIWFRRNNIPFVLDLLMENNLLTKTQADTIHQILVDTRTLPICAYNFKINSARVNSSYYNDVPYVLSETGTLAALRTAANDLLGKCSGLVASMTTQQTADFIAEAHRLGVMTTMGWVSTVSDADAKFALGYDFLWSDNLTSFDFEEAST